MSELPPDRRGFLGWVAAGIAAIPFAGGAALALAGAWFRPRAVRPGAVPLCKVSDVPPEGLIARPVSYDVRRGASVEQVAEIVFLSRSEGQIVAMSSRCTHLGCPVVFRPGHEGAPLHCPCHDAHFNARGEVLDGPAARPLDRLEIVVPTQADGTPDPDGIVQWVLTS